jgi:acetyl-CoA carboxylase carboxyltransferase component
MEPDAIQKIKQKALLGGGQPKIDKQHNAGRLTARERIEHLLDPGSFTELNMLAGHAVNRAAEGVITGFGKIDGRMVCVFAQDFTVSGGATSVLHSQKLNRTIKRAIDMRVPCIGLWETAGGWIRKPGSYQVEDTEQAGDERNESVFYLNTKASGCIPQISAILGSCAGVGGYAPSLTDFIFMPDKTSYTFVTGPKVVQSVTGEEVTLEQLGGAKVHASVSGVCDFRTKDEAECFVQIRKLLSYLPMNCGEMPPRAISDDDPKREDEFIDVLVPSDPRRPYNMHTVIRKLGDDGDFFEVKKEFAPEIIVGFTRLDGYTVGIIANQPMVKAGCLTANSSDKHARFIRFCDAFNIPLVMLVDTSAYLPSTQEEHAGLLRHGAKVLYAHSEAIVPKISVVLRKAYGGGQAAMGVWPGMQSDLVYAWPLAEIATVGAEQAVELFFRKELETVTDPLEFRAQKIKEYRDVYANPMMLASRSPFLHDVIEAKHTRATLIKALELMRHKPTARRSKKHGNIPL